jgi:hypothetical protein
MGARAGERRHHDTIGQIEGAHFQWVKQGRHRVSSDFGSLKELGSDPPGYNCADNMVFMPAA